MASLSAGCKAVALARIILLLAASGLLAAQAQTVPPDPMDSIRLPTRVTDPRGLVTQYRRNGFGDVQQRISPDSGTDLLTYDAARNLKTRTDSRGVLTTYSYDPSDRLTGATYTKSGQPTETVTLVYSQTGPGFSYGHGKLTSSSYPGGSAQYGYDPQGKLIQDLQRVDAAAGANSTQLSQAVVYDYTLGDLTGITYPSGRWLSQTRVDGEITQIALGGIPLITQIEWTPFAGAVRRWKWNMASGPKTHERYFDLAGRMIRHPLGDMLRDLRYDAANRIVSFTHLLPDGTPQPASDQRFTHDENDRLTGIMTATASWAITYDANGNRTSVSLNGSPSNCSIEETSNRLTGITNPARSFSYDNAGNTTVDASPGGGYSATYNLRGQLASTTHGGVTTTYTYNAAGQRVRKVSSTGPQSTMVFVYDHLGHLLGEYDRNGTPLREYAWLRDTPIAMFMPDPSLPDPSSGVPLVFYIHTDHLDAPRIVLDRDNHQRWRWFAEPFGTTAPEANPEGHGDFTQNLRFPGQYADAESGLWYNYFRSYDPSRGGYSQADPIGLASGGLSNYSYALGNPLALVDPQGLETYVVINANGLGHAGLVVGNGPSAMLYDPGGSYRNKEKGSGDALEGTLANLDAYVKYQRTDGPDVRVVVLSTSPEEEAVLQQRILDQGGCMPGLCATCVGSVLRSVQRFRTMGSTMTPGGLGRELDRVLNPPVPSPFIPDEAWGWR